ncbi:MAG: hypothetical protein IKD31_04475 [Clostridia bacterium]|nr:hypothetical protein [Clostridia bacterium]
MTKTKEKKSKSEKTNRNRRGYSFLGALFSLFAALVLWFYVQDAESPDYRKTFHSVPVSMQSLSSSFSVIEGGENTVDITLVGKRSDLNKIKNSDLEAYLDLSSINRPGNYQPEISVLVPEGAELFECFPQKATLFVDQTISLSIPVRVELGSYTADAGIGIDAVPALSAILVKGPKTILEQISYAKVSTGDLGQVTTGFERNAPYELCNSDGRVINSRYVIMPERNIRVQLEVYKTKEVPLTVKSKNGWWEGNGLSYNVSPKSVIIKGDPALIDSVNSIPALILDEQSLDANHYEATLSPGQLVLPDGVELGETLGDIAVSMVLEDYTFRTLRMNLSHTHVAVTAPSGGLTYDFADDYLEFKIRGGGNVLSAATLNDFYLNIDLSYLDTVGKAEVPVQIVQTSASEGKYYAVGNYTVEVEITK